MATLNELGRNSASVTYGPSASGADVFPTLQAVDTWFRNDTWQGTAINGVDAYTLTGSGTIWTTQARAGDYIIVAGQQRIVNTVSADNTLTVTVAFSPTITVASAVKVVSNTQPKQVTGYLTSFARGSTNGTVSVTANSSTITGVGTYFLSEATNSVTTVVMTGTVAIAVDGTITGTSTVFSTGAPSNNSLYPGDSIAVTSNGAIYYFTIANASITDSSATVTVPPTTAISAGATIAKATNGTTGRSIQINGRMRTITAIASNTSMTVNYPMDFTDSNLRYKVYPRGTIANSTAGTLYGSTSATSSNSTTLTIAATLTGVIQPGCVISAPLGVSNVPANTTIVNQQFGALGASVANTSATGTSGQNTLSLTSATGVLVGQLVCGNGATITGIPAGTYVVSISGTTITLSQNLTGAIGTTVYFYTPGGLGAYTTNNATTITGTQVYFSTVQITNGNLFWDLGYNNLNSTTNTVYMYQTSQLDNIWIGDEVRIANFSTYSGASISNIGVYGYLTDYSGFSGTAIGSLRQTVSGLPYKREDSYINGNPYGTLTSFTTDFRVGDDIIIDGTECTVSQIVSDSQLKVNIDFTHTTANNSNGTATATTSYSSGGAPGATTVTMSSNTGVLAGQLITGVGLPQGTYVVSIATNTFTLSKAFNTQANGTYSFYNGTNIYKKLKLHGYVLEGTREGGTGLQGSTTAGATAAVVTGSTTGSTTNLTIASIANGTGSVALPGMQVLPSTTGGGAALANGFIYITNQQYGTGATINFTTSGSTATGQNAIVFGSSPTTVTVGMIIQNAASTAFSYGPLSTYVIAVNTTTNTVYLSNNITTTIPTSTALYFIAAGGNGVYTTTASTTLSATASSFYTPATGKFTQATTILATGGTSYPIGTQQITLAATPAVGTNNFIKISGAGGPPQVLTGQVTYASSFVYGTNTLFTTQLHIGAEIIVAGQYLTVVSITSDTVLNVAQNAGTSVVAVLTPIYRSVPLYTYMTSVSGAVVNLATPIKNNLYSTGVNPPTVYLPSTGADFLEYVYSAPNYSAEQGSTTLLNQSLDRKYVGFRYWPLFQSTNIAPTNTSTISTAFGAYATPVYERWTASYAQSHGVGINQADLSGGTMVWAYQTTTTLNVTMPVCGSVHLQMGLQGQSTGYPQVMTGYTANNIMGTCNITYTGLTASQTVASNAAPAAWVASLYGVYDITAMTQVSGGTIFLFGNKRYFALQGRSSANQQTQWVGCLEFERAQPEDASSGTGTTTGITFGGTSYGGYQMAEGASPPTVSTPGFSQVIQYVSGTAPYPTFAYFNGNRMPTGAQQIPTLPQLGVAAYPVHGCVLSVPRVRNSAGDLVGMNAHIYSALTITTGRWGHLLEIGNYGTYAPAYTSASASVTATSNTLTLAANTVPQPHMGQIVPVYTNIYNAKRFMFSPVVVLGPAYDPDIRGRIYGLKVLPSGLGTLMDTVSITVDGNYFYNTSFSSTDHWVIGSPPSWTATTAYPGQTTVVTMRFTLTANAGGITQSWRSLEDTGSQASSTGTGLTTNNFRFALPA